MRTVTVPPSSDRLPAQSARQPIAKRPRRLHIGLAAQTVLGKPLAASASSGSCVLRNSNTGDSSAGTVGITGRTTIGGYVMSGFKTLRLDAVDTLRDDDTGADWITLRHRLGVTAFGLTPTARPRRASR